MNPKSFQRHVEDLIKAGVPILKEIRDKETFYKRIGHVSIDPLWEVESHDDDILADLEIPFDHLVDFSFTEHTSRKVIIAICCVDKCSDDCGTTVEVI